MSQRRKGAKCLTQVGGSKVSLMFILKWLQEVSEDTPEVVNFSFNVP
jgi:uncharacterized Fe-S radical SAM superfamily protein PflX